jgi:hypothetical protein
MAFVGLYDLYGLLVFLAFSANFNTVMDIILKGFLSKLHWPLMAFAGLFGLF